MGATRKRVFSPSRSLGSTQTRISPMSDGSVAHSASYFFSLASIGVISAVHDYYSEYHDYYDDVVLMVFYYIILLLLLLYFRPSS